MIDWSVFVPTFLAAGVEWIEAFTIVLAVSLSIGWSRAIGAAATALAALAAMTVATGGVLRLGVAMDDLELVIGALLLLFGVRWLAKAIARHAGLKALHDEDKEFAETREELSHGDRHAAWLIAFKGVMLEGLEVWLIVVALGLKSPSPWSSAAGAIAALVLVIAAGALVQKPLRQVPENAIKFVVGAMIVSFGSYWTLEALAPGAWPDGDWSLFALFAFYLLGGLAIAMALRRQHVRETAR